VSGGRALGGSGAAPGLFDSEWAPRPGSGGSGRLLSSPAEAARPALGARQEPWLLRQQGLGEWQGQALSGASTPTHCQRLPQAAHGPATSQPELSLGGGSLWSSPADTGVRAAQSLLRQPGTPASGSLGGWPGGQAPASSSDQSPLLYQHEAQYYPGPLPPQQQQQQHAQSPQAQPQQPLSLYGFMDGLAAEQRAKEAALAAGAAGSQGSAEQEPGRVRASYGAFSWSW
jgi:hypothetical protein